MTAQNGFNNTGENKRLLVLRLATDVFRFPQKICFEVESSGIPFDARLAWSFFDAVRQQFCNVFEHESFPLVIEGCAIPAAEPPMLRHIELCPTCRANLEDD